MKIPILRQQTNALYTEGRLLVNDRNSIPYTVENTRTMLPDGFYRVFLHKIKTQGRVIVVCPLRVKTPRETLSLIGLGHSFITSAERRTIVIGELFFPGAAYKGTPHYDRLFDRIEKCQHRQEPITLEICSTYCQPVAPHFHWINKK